MNETDIQEYIYNNLILLPKWVKISNNCFDTNKELLIDKPGKYLVYKKYGEILERIGRTWNEDYLYKFPREYITAECGNSRPRIDVLCHTSDPNTFWITEIKYNKQPERQTLTELLQYANGLQTSDFTGLPNDSIVFIVIAKDWSNILIQSIINAIFFKGIYVLPLSINNTSQIKDLKIDIYDITKLKVFEHFDKLIFNNDSYCYRLIAFDAQKPEYKKILNITEDHKKNLSAMIANEYSRVGYNGSIIFMENNEGLYFTYIFAILTFDPFFYENKMEGKGTSKSLFEFHKSNDDFQINEKYAKEQIKFIFPDGIEFESGNGKGRGLSGISASGYIFSWSYPIGWFHEIISDAIKFSRTDEVWGKKIFGGDSFNSGDEIYSWWFINKLFNKDE